jgi:hypothetical protein
LIIGVYKNRKKYFKSNKVAFLPASCPSPSTNPDEIDHIKEIERDSIIYNLCNTGNIGLICISNSRDALCEVDNRIKSRLNAKQIELEPYTGIELLGILS